MTISVRKVAAAAALSAALTASLAGCGGSGPQDAGREARLGTPAASAPAASAPGSAAPSPSSSSGAPGA
ncbi:hypothetical protein SIN09_32815, partial [Streptomyces sp. F8]|nr:hypothetical protein [Streptomyces sp. F8]